MLLGWSHRYISYSVVITIWMTVAIYPSLNWQWIFSFLYVDCFSFLYHRHDFHRNWLYIWVTWRVSYKKQELLTLGRHGFTLGFSGIRVLVVSVLLNFLVFRVVFRLFSSCILCAQCCQCLCIVHSWLPLRFSLTFFKTICWNFKFYWSRKILFWEMMMKNSGYLFLTFIL